MPRLTASLSFLRRRWTELVLAGLATPFFVAAVRFPPSAGGGITIAGQIADLKKSPDCTTLTFQVGTVKLASNLFQSGHRALCDFLQEGLDVELTAWTQVSQWPDDRLAILRLTHLGKDILPQSSRRLQGWLVSLVSFLLGAFLLWLSISALRREDSLMERYVSARGKMAAGDESRHQERALTTGHYRLKGLGLIAVAVISAFIAFALISLKRDASAGAAAVAFMISFVAAIVGAYQVVFGRSPGAKSESAIKRIAFGTTTGCLVLILGLLLLLVLSSLQRL